MREEYKCPECSYSLSALQEKKGFRLFCAKCKWKDTKVMSLNQFLDDWNNY